MTRNSSSFSHTSVKAIMIKRLSFFPSVHHRITNPAKMNCIIPCDLRSNPATITMGNQVAHLCLELPMNTEGNIPLLWAFNDSTKHMKQSGDYATMYLFTRIIYLLFPFCFGRFENVFHPIVHLFLIISSE